MERIFYKTDISDPTTNLPLFIFDTSFLPSTDSINYEEFIPTLMSFIPTKPYVLIMFSCGLNKISWIWGIKFLKKFLAESDNLYNLKKIITIHDSWFVKSITQILANYNSTKKNLAQINKLIDAFTITPFQDLSDGATLNEKNIIINCSSLSQLSNYVDITRLKISLNIYKYNLLVENNLILSMRVVPLINPYTKLNKKTDPTFYHHFYQIFNIINNFGHKVELIFHKPGNKLNSDILNQCINRNQLIWINDWDLYCISTAFKKILMELPKPLVPIESIELPISDEYDYTSHTFKMLIDELERDDGEYGQLLVQLCDLCVKILSQSQITKHTSITLSKSLSYCLSHELISSHNKDNISIVSRFFKNVLDHWSRLGQEYKHRFRTIEQIMNSDKSAGKEEVPDDSYELSYDLSLDEVEDNHRVSFNTSTILSTNSKLSKSNLTQPYMAQTPVSSPNKATSHTPKSVTSLRSGSPNEHQEGTDSMFSGYSSNSSVSTVTSSAKSPPSRKSTKKLSDVSNLHVQYPPQKYKFSGETRKASQHSRSKSLPPQFVESTTAVRKPVIRGRKVGELAKLFEERSEGLELLNSM